jgi:hypothetical protein
MSVGMLSILALSCTWSVDEAYPGTSAKLNTYE